MPAGVIQGWKKRGGPSEAVRARRGRARKLLAMHEKLSTLRVRGDLDSQLPSRSPSYPRRDEPREGGLGSAGNMDSLPSPASERSAGNDTQCFRLSLLPTARPGVTAELKFCRDRASRQAQSKRVPSIDAQENEEINSTRREALLRSNFRQSARNASSILMVDGVLHAPLLDARDVIRNREVT
jgi:hypothetical protein